MPVRVLAPGGDEGAESGVSSQSKVLMLKRCLEDWVPKIRLLQMLSQMQMQLRVEP